MSRSVLQDWVQELPFRMQTVLMCSLRGHDGLPKDHVSKQLVRAIRRTVLLDADPSNPFIGGMRLTILEVLKEMRTTVDEMSVHFLMHSIHASEIIAYRYPEQRTREVWMNVYEGLVDALHLNTETRDQFEMRLGKTTVEWETYGGD